MTATDTLAPNTLAADTEIEVGHHIPLTIGGLEFNLDTIIGTGVAALVLLGLAFYLRSKVTSGVPNGVQLFFETVTTQMRGQIEGAIGMRVAPFVLPLAVALFSFILISNWLSVIPAQYGGSNGSAQEWLKPPASDVNFVYALAILVFLMYHAAGFRRRGALGYPKKLVRGHVAILAPINVIEEIAKPVSLSLRLFGNIFAGGIMIALITLFPPYVAWAPHVVWKLFDLFVGLIQAFIFALLTILYFSQSMESEDAH